MVSVKRGRDDAEVVFSVGMRVKSTYSAIVMLMLMVYVMEDSSKWVEELMRWCVPESVSRCRFERVKETG